MSVHLALTPPHGTNLRKRCGFMEVSEVMTRHRLVAPLPCETDHVPLVDQLLSTYRLAKSVDLLHVFLFIRCRQTLLSQLQVDVL